jgi:uncharacterized protein (UPF0333 family)
MEDKHLITGLLVVILALSICVVYFQSESSNNKTDLKENVDFVTSTLCKAEPANTTLVNTIEYKCGGKVVKWVQQKGN